MTKETLQRELDGHRYEHHKYKRMYEDARGNGIVESINVNWKEKLYKKVGKKYVQVNDPYAYNGLREGWWLVGVKAGTTSIRHCVYPARADLQAAAQEMEEKLVDIIRKATEARPAKTKLTPEEKKDWDAFAKKHGEAFNTLHYPSFYDNAQEIIKAILNSGKQSDK